MWNEKLLVTDLKQNILYVGKKVLPFANLQNERPFGYPEGKAEPGDILICFLRNPAERTEDLTILSERKICRNDVFEAENLILVICIGNHEIKPLVKNITVQDNVSTQVYLDTIYERNEIRIVQTNETVLFYLNGQTLQWELNDGTCAVTLIKDHNIKYFASAEKSEPLLQPLLCGEKYPAYMRKELIYGYPLKAFLQERVFEKIMMLDACKSEDGVSFVHRGVGVSLRKLSISMDGMNAVGYTFEDAETLIDELAVKAQRYKLLTSGNLEGMTKEPHFNSFRFWGNEERIRQMGHLLQKCCVTNTTVLLTGESGTGKTFLAKEIHRNSRRNQAPFVHVNCAAIPYQLIESELFGYEEGAFTGAKKGGKKGYFEMAYGGTLFLDEIGEMPLALQGKLLEVLQSRTFYPVGGTRKIEADVRLIAATNKNLRDMVREKRFREDLYYRINVFPIEIPPLRERRASLYGIIMDLLPDICSRLEIEPVLLSSQAFEKMTQYPWPGNIRELENVLEKAAILSDGKIILPEDVILSELEPFTAAAVTLQEVREQAERQAIENALLMFHGDKNKAARYLDIGRSNMFEKVKRYRIQVKEMDEDDIR